MTNASQLSGGVFDGEATGRRLREIEESLSRPGAWDQPDRLTPLLQEKSRLENDRARLDALKASHDDMLVWLELAEADPADNEALESLNAASDALQHSIEETELVMLLSGEEDDCHAILEIHPGAGGTESQDWAEMLLRMYVRWGAAHGFAVRELDYLPGDEAGLKSVTLRFEGPYAFGLLKSEKGIHRLIRISPFDASGRRHTSFASVDVIPEVRDDIVVDIKEGDLHIDVYRASGAGGQHVNRTESAVRITHIPTGIVVQCQDDRSQHSNRESAMRVLRARLYNLERERRDEEKQAEYAGKDAIAFGSQIRTYTLHPYRLAKDHRTGTEVSDVDAVLDGGIDIFQHDYLIHLHERRS